MADGDSRAQADRRSIGRAQIRPVIVPAGAPRRDGFQAATPGVEVRIADAGFLPVHAVLPTDEATEEHIRRLAASRRDLPRLDTSRNLGAVDVRLEAADGRRLKEGTLAVVGEDGRSHAVPIDPVTRRFRLGALAPGRYRVRAAAASIGRAETDVVVRAGDVIRLALPLAGTQSPGEVTLVFAVRGEAPDTLHVRVTDRGTGKVVVDRPVSVSNGRASLTLAQAGRYHVDVAGALGIEQTSCYDVDAGDGPILQIQPPLVIEATRPIPRPDPPEWLVLPEELLGMTEVLPRLGVTSMEALASAEPEALMHRARTLGAPLHTRMIAASIEAAQRHTGTTAAARETRLPLRLGRARGLTTTFRVEQAGTLELALDLGRGGLAEVVIAGLSERRTERVEERADIQVPITAEEAGKGASVTVTVTNRAALAIAGSLVATVSNAPSGFGTIVTRPIEERIANIYRAVAVQNPGIATSVNPAVMMPANIRMWLDHARTIMRELGVCSINDVGTLRISPNQVLHPGAYIAPARRPGSLVAGALTKYAFAGVINDTVLHYVPNEVLHDMAVIIGGEWDIRNQTIYIGEEVRELLVIVKSIGYNASSSITWQMPTLPVAHTYFPATAAHGAHAITWGQDGFPGQSGDPDPSADKNGGHHAPISAPVVTMYILDTTGNLPPIDLGGQPGGAGGRGQNGGNGGNGFEGLRAEGTFFGGCCRGVGFGGDGGAGGNAGRGGPGGNGNEGGKLTLLTTPPGIVVLEAATPSIDILPGNGGSGGSPGTAGVGGQGGPAGTADCEIWCDEHPERIGSPGPSGLTGLTGRKGTRGPGPASDAFQIIPITEEQWNEEFNNPHIFQLVPAVIEPGGHVTVHGANFDPALDHVFFDGDDMGSVFNTTDVVFQVPLAAEGGYHPVVIKPTGNSPRRSNKAQLHILPTLDAIPSNTRWNEGDIVTLTGLAFRQGCHVHAEDWSTNPITSFNLPTSSVTRTEISLTIPGPPLQNLRGVRRILVRNPSGGTTKDERVARIGDTIIVRCVAFRAVGETTGVTTAHSAAQIAGLFTEGSATGVGLPWGQARIAFVLAQPVQDVLVPDGTANVFPKLNAKDDVQDALDGMYVPGALNFIFVKDVESSTAYAWYGGGPLVIGDEPNQVLNAVDLRHLVAHEIGHSLCLAHVCSIGAEEDDDGGLFGHDCGEADEPFLMHPQWGLSESMTLTQVQIDGARLGATHFETGKTDGLALSSLFKGRDPLPSQCMTADTKD